MEFGFAAFDDVVTLTVRAADGDERHGPFLPMRSYEDEAQCDIYLSPSPLLKHYPQGQVLFMTTILSSYSIKTCKAALSRASTVRLPSWLARTARTAFSASVCRYPKLSNAETTSRITCSSAVTTGWLGPALGRSRAAILSCNSSTTRSAVLRPTPGIACNCRASACAIAWRRSAADRLESMVSARRGPTDATLRRRSKRSCSSGVAKP